VYTEEQQVLDLT